jgi:hypothetical protein
VIRDRTAKRKSRAKALLENPHLNPLVPRTYLILGVRTVAVKSLYASGHPPKTWTAFPKSRKRDGGFGIA